MAPDGKPASNVGCVIAIVALPIVLFVGVVIGTVLRNDDEAPEEEHVTLDEGELDGTAWRIDAVRDVDGQTCVFLYEDEAEDPLNGTCDLQPQDVTYGDQTIVFGRAEAGATEVEVQLSNDEVATIQTVTADGMDGRFYVEVIEGDLNAESVAT